ncbi:uncharacterized protein LOC135167193 [Diachasmimorpha longicaudata]|uniref:uncharacterized protein LOC135167193 n=1 Tax=Diachasmimorpha longicaudata TaxID=58733 RepID=UPI0030B8708B
MKVFVVILSTCLIGALAQELTEAQKQKVRENRDACITETGADREEVNKANKGEWADNAKIRCFTLCMLKKWGMMNDAGVLDEAAARQKMGLQMKPEKVEEIMTKCKYLKGDTACDTAYMMMKCYTDNRAVTLFDMRLAMKKSSHCVRLVPDAYIGGHFLQTIFTYQHAFATGSNFRELRIIQQLIMKFLVIAVLVCIVGALASEQRETPEARRQRYRDACRAETGADQADIDKARKGEWADKENLRCYTLCMLKKGNLMNDEGVLDEIVTRDTLARKLPAEQINDIMAKCKDLKGSNACGTAQRIMKCYNEQKTHLM